MSENPAVGRPGCHARTGRVEAQKNPGKQCCDAGTGLEAQRNSQKQCSDAGTGVEAQSPEKQCSDAGTGRHEAGTGRHEAGTELVYIASGMDGTVCLACMAKELVRKVVTHHIAPHISLS